MVVQIPSIMENFTVDAMPTFIIYQKGKEVWRKQGVISQDEMVAVINKVSIKKQPLVSYGCITMSPQFAIEKVRLIISLQFCRPECLHEFLFSSPTTAPPVSVNAPQTRPKSFSVLSFR
jgi:hypothetical protein